MQADTNLYPYCVTIPWRKGDTTNRWDEICIGCVEQFGLPGDKYKTNVSEYYMSFYFKNQQDAIWFSLKSE